VLVMVHGIGGDANTFFCDALKAVGGHSGPVGVVAPWFGNEPVRLRAWAGPAAARAAGAADPTSLHWSGGNWNQGGGAADAPGTASFAALDAIVAAVIAAHGRHASSRSSRLKQVVVAGFSAGAQMVQRYAWATAHGAPGSSPPVKFVVSDPSTFLYFDERRPAPSCAPLRDTGAGAAGCSSFARPASAASCPDFDTYRLGLQGLASGSPYFSQARIARNPAALSAAYLQKQILYVFGGADACNCLTQGYENPAACMRALASPAEGCHKSNAGPSCCDMPNGKRTNSFVLVECGDMLQVRRRACACGHVVWGRGATNARGVRKRQGAHPPALLCGDATTHHPPFRHRCCCCCCCCTAARCPAPGDCRAPTGCSGACCSRRT
jgi:hypothetical protein